MRITPFVAAALFALAACHSRADEPDAREPVATNGVAPAVEEGAAIPSAPVGADGKYHSGIADMDATSREAMRTAIAAIPADMRVPAENLVLCRENRTGTPLPAAERADALARAYADIRADPSLATRCDAPSSAPRPDATSEAEPAGARAPVADPVYRPSSEALSRSARE